MSYFLFGWLLKRSEWILLKYIVPVITAALTIIPIMAYKAISGFATPVVRAMIIALLYLISIIIGIDHLKFNTLAAAAFIILFIDTSALFYLSFRLSFLSVLGILIMYHCYPLLRAEFKDKVFTTLKTTLEATTFTLPFIVNTFSAVSLLSVAANLLYIPLVEFIIMPLCILSFALFNISVWLSEALIQFNGKIIDALLLSVENISNFGFSSITVHYLSNGNVLLYYVSVLLIFFYTKSSKIIKIAASSFTVLFFFSVGMQYVDSSTNDRFEVYVLDAGDRNTVFVESENGSNLLINASRSGSI